MTRSSSVIAPISIVVVAAIVGAGCTSQAPATLAASGPTPVSTSAGRSATTFAMTTDTVRVHAPVNFTLSGCPEFPGLTISGAGDDFLVMNFRTGPDGVTYIERNDLVTGTATDNQGGSYLFNYHNHSNMEIPPNGFPWSFETTDHFNLVGKGKGNQMAVSFVARVTFTSPTDPPQAEFVHMHGNPSSCDPI